MPEFVHAKSIGWSALSMYQKLVSSFGDLMRFASLEPRRTGFPNKKSMSGAYHVWLEIGPAVEDHQV